MPTNSLYQKISGEAYAPDLKGLHSQKIVVDIVTGAARSGQNILQLRTPEHAAADWAFLFSARDVAGNKYNADYEQDADQFQVLVAANNSLVVQGRTRNWKHGVWGKWAPGDANYLGVATVKTPSITT